MTGLLILCISIGSHMLWWVKFWRIVTNSKLSNSSKFNISIANTHCFAFGMWQSTELRYELEEWVSIMPGIQFAIRDNITLIMTYSYVSGGSMGGMNSQPEFNFCNRKLLEFIPIRKFHSNFQYFSLLLCVVIKDSATAEVHGYSYGMYDLHFHHR